MNQIDMPMDYHGVQYWNTERYTPKLTNSTKLKDCFADNIE